MRRPPPLALLPCGVARGLPVAHRVGVGLGSPRFSAVSGVTLWLHGLRRCPLCPRPWERFQSGDSLQIAVSTRAGGGQPRGPAPQPRAGRSLPAPAGSNFSPMLLRRSCVSPAYSLWTAASCILLGIRSRCPPRPTPCPFGAHPSQSTHSLKRPSHPQTLELWAGAGHLPGGQEKQSNNSQEGAFPSFSPAGQSPWRGHQSGQGMNAQPCAA